MHVVGYFRLRILYGCIRKYDTLQRCVRYVFIVSYVLIGITYVVRTAP